MISSQQILEEMWRLALAFLSLLLAAPNLAAAPADDISFERRRYTLAHGAPPQAFGMAQTADGMLWLTSPKGLYSFDGIQFKRQPTVLGAALLSSNTSAVHVLSGDRIAVGYAFGGLSIFSKSSARHFKPGHSAPSGTVYAITENKGDVYACTTTGIFQLRGAAWIEIGNGSLPNVPVYAIGFDQDRTLWAMTTDEIYARPVGTMKFNLVSKFISPSQLDFFQDKPIIKLPSGAFARAHASGHLEPVMLKNARRYESLTGGPQGTLIGKRQGGFAHLAQDAQGTWLEVDYYPPVYGEAEHAMSNGIGITAFKDREDNLWWTTYDGIEKIRAHRFHLIKRKDSLWLAQQGIGDEMWLGGREQPMLRRLPDGTLQKTKVKRIHAILRAAPNHVWVGAEDGLWEFRQGMERRWELPSALKGQYDIQALARDADGTLLVSIIRNGLWRFESGAWTKDERLQHLPDATPISMLQDSGGQTWVGLTNNRIGKLMPGALHLLPAAGRQDLGNVLSMLNVAGRLLVGGDNGVAWIDGEQVRHMTLAQYGRPQRITGLAFDKLGQLWLHSNDGLLMVPSTELEKFWRAPGNVVTAELFDFEDGVIGAAAAIRPLPSLSTDMSGRLFYASTSQVGWIDPGQIRRNPQAPSIVIESVRTDAGEFRPVEGMALPKLTSAVEFKFTATALSIPERVKLQYRLDGVDAKWQSAQHHRIAQYSNLAPGHYRFQVIAANEDGVWNREGQVLSFHIPPAFWQTWWFKLACGLMLLVAAYLAYRRRIASVRSKAERLAYASAGERLEATLSERRRIARCLHDNLLQAVQALILRFNNLRCDMSQDPGLQSRLDKVLSYAEELVASTRDEVMNLRKGMSCDELFRELGSALSRAAPGAEDMLNCSVSGTSKPVQHEIFYVLREAVWNSARHAQPSQIMVSLHFDKDQIEGTVKDDGVGIRDAVCAVHMARSWGIVGMRERIQRLGGQLTIGGGNQYGVVITFKIPAEHAFC